MLLHNVCNGKESICTKYVFSTLQHVLEINVKTRDKRSQSNKYHKSIKKSKSRFSPVFFNGFHFKTTRLAFLLYIFLITLIAWPITGFRLDIDFRTSSIHNYLYFVFFFTIFLSAFTSSRCRSWWPEAPSAASPPLFWWRRRAAACSASLRPPTSTGGSSLGPSSIYGSAPVDNDTVKLAKLYSSIHSLRGGEPLFITDKMK